jgi:dienelactone hydrolase
LASKRNITVVTNGVKALSKLAEYDINTISTGGNLVNSCLALVGEEAYKTIETINADIAFFSCRGVSADGYLTDISPEENNARKRMIKRAKRAYLLAASEKFGKNRPLIIGGVSMGAATVMMASGEELPENVVCVMADCGYSTAREIIKKVVREMKLPENLVYPFIKLGARIYGHFDLEETSPIEAVARSKTPIVFIHGDNDDFVPHSMSVACFEACNAPKKLVTIEGAGHGLAFPVNGKKYVDSLREFETEANLLKK